MNQAHILEMPPDDLLFLGYDGTLHPGEVDTERSRQTLDLQHKQLGFQVLVALPTIDAGKVRELFDRELQFAMIDGLPKGSGTRITHLVQQVELKKEQIARTRERTRERIAREEREAMDRKLREAQAAAGG